MNICQYVQYEPPKSSTGMSAIDSFLFPQSLLWHFSSKVTCLFYCFRKQLWFSLSFWKQGPVVPLLCMKKFKLSITFCTNTPSHSRTHLWYFGHFGHFHPETHWRHCSLWCCTLWGVESHLTLLIDEAKRNTGLRGGWREMQFLTTRDIACLYLSVFLYIWPRRQRQCASSEAAPMGPLFQLHNVLTESEAETKREGGDRERKPDVKVSNKTKRCCAPRCDRRFWPCLWRSGTAERLSEAIYLSACPFVSQLFFDWWIHLRTEAETVFGSKFNKQGWKVNSQTSFIKKPLAIIKCWFALITSLRQHELM